MSTPISSSPGASEVIAEAPIPRPAPWISVEDFRLIPTAAAYAHGRAFTPMAALDLPTNGILWSRADTYVLRNADYRCTPPRTYRPAAREQHRVCSATLNEGVMLFHMHPPVRPGDPPRATTGQRRPAAPPRTVRGVTRRGIPLRCRGPDPSPVVHHS